LPNSLFAPTIESIRFKNARLSGINVVLSDIDRRLLARCLEGTDGAWDEFVDRFLPLIVHVVNATGKLRFGEIPQPTRDDLVADVFLKLVEDDFAVLRRFRGQSSLGTYLVVVCRRIAGRKLAQMSRVTTTPLTEDPIDRREQTDLQLENNEEVQSMLNKMPTAEATAIRMYHLEERSYQDIGSHMGIPENSVGPLLTQARQRLRTMRNA
jgi:RNA polymerase sigma-70 factor, ECF subfamily